MGVEVVEGRALGTSLRLAVTRPRRLAAARAAVEAVVARIDQVCSRFREDSELSRLNRAAGARTEVSPLMMAALATAIRAAQLSDGAVDPTVGGAMRAAGYGEDFALIVRERGQLGMPTGPVPGWRRLELDQPRRLARIPAGIELDLGSTAKALAADLAATAALASAGGGGVLVSQGGDIAMAGGPPEGGWRILVADDSAEPADAQGEIIRVQEGAVATSSITVRRWQRGARTLHHIIDPATGRPTEGRWRTVSVVASTCVDANIAATAAIVRDREAIGRLTALQLPARLVDGDGRVTSTPGWPARHGWDAVPAARG